MADKMTIDDIQALAHEESQLLKTDGNNQGMYALNRIWRFIDDNREALTAGMQKPLRFRQGTNPYGMKVFTAITSEDKYSGLVFAHFDKDATEEEVAGIMDSLGLPCEFIDT